MEDQEGTMAGGEAAIGVAVAVAAVRPEGGGVAGAHDVDVLGERWHFCDFTNSYGKSAWLKVTPWEPGVVGLGSIQTRGKGLFGRGHTEASNVTTASRWIGTCYS